MQGYQLTFYSQQDRTVQGQPVAHWLLRCAQELGIAGGTVLSAAEGLGHDHRLHMARFFELADQPVEVVFVLSEADAQRLMAAVGQAPLRVFYTRSPVEFGTLGQSLDTDTSAAV